MLARPSALGLLVGLLVCPLVALLAASISSCTGNGVEPLPPAYEEIIETFGLTALPPVIYPQYNQYNPARIALGRLLFFDPILGGESAPWIKAAATLPPTFRANDVACGTCHHPAFAFGDGRKLGAGVSGSGADGTDLGTDRIVPGASIVSGAPVGIEPRNSQSILNTAFNGKNSPQPDAESFQFVDGRVTLGLEVQAQEPVTDREEMAGDAYGRGVLGQSLSIDAVRDSVTRRIRNIPAYVELFKEAYPVEITGAENINLNHIGKAIAAYERELNTPDSRYDRFVSGDAGALSAREKQGFELFFGKALCGDCHVGPMLSDFGFHVQGAGDAYEPGFPGKDGQGRDLGRYHANPVDFADRKFAFRTLTIRNVELTAPYFHSGSAATLRDVVAFYNRGGLGPEDVSDAELAADGAGRHPSIRPLGLTDGEIDAIVAFMRTTTAPVPPGPDGLDLDSVPATVPSGLVPPGIPSPPGP
jgi:cytochrome c peroxidase